jgi:hypothetical protein
MADRVLSLDLKIMICSYEKSILFLLQVDVDVHFFFPCVWVFCMVKKIAITSAPSVSFSDRRSAIVRTVFSAILRYVCSKIKTTSHHYTHPTSQHKKQQHKQHVCTWYKQGIKVVISRLHMSNES